MSSMRKMFYLSTACRCTFYRWISLGYTLCGKIRCLAEIAGKGIQMQLAFLLATLAFGMFQEAVKPLSQDTLKHYIERNETPYDFILIDVRSVGEIKAAIGNGVCKPYNLVWAEQFKDFSSKVPKDSAIVVYCQSGMRSARAASFLNAVGYMNVYNAGGFLTWTGPTVTPSDIRPASLLPEPSMKACTTAKIPEARSVHPFSADKPAFGMFSVSGGR